MKEAQLHGIDVIRRFVLAGNAIFTIRSPRTGVRFTYRVRQPKKDSPHFVGVLTGSNNTRDYSFLGSIFDARNYAYGNKSEISIEASSAQAFYWFWSSLTKGTLPSALDVYHEGRCGRCGRLLTVPESLDSGIGPDCASRLS